MPRTRVSGSGLLTRPCGRALAEVLVRLVHEAEATLKHAKPRLGVKNTDNISVVKCVGKHHKDILHEITDLIDEQSFDVIHADFSTSNAGVETNTLYIHKKDAGLTSRDERELLKDAIKAKYGSLSLDGKISVTPANHLSPSMTSTDPKEKPPASPLGMSLLRRQSLPTISSLSPSKREGETSPTSGSGGSSIFRRQSCQPTSKSSMSPPASPKLAAVNPPSPTLAAASSPTSSPKLAAASSPPSSPKAAAGSPPEKV